MASVSDLRSELESSDIIHQTQALVVLLNHLSTEREVGNLPSLVCQKVIAAGGTPPPVRLLAYDVVRLANLTTADWEAICRSLKADLSGQLHPETAAAALALVPSIPAVQLISLVAREDFGPVLAQCLRSEVEEIRLPAVEAFSAALGLEDVLEAICSSPGLVSSVTEWWSAVSNAVLDDSNRVATAAHQAMWSLLNDDHSSSLSTDGQQLRRQLVQHLTRRIMYGLTQMIQRAAHLPKPSQVYVVRLLVLAVTMVNGAVAGKEAGAVGWRSGTGGGLGPSNEEQGSSLFGASGPADVQPSGSLLAWALNEIGRYLAKQMAVMDPVVSVEAARGLLQIAKLPAPDLLQASASSDPSATSAVSRSFPAEWTTGAVTALLALWTHPEAEVVRPEILESCCGCITILEPAARAAAIRNLLQLAGGLPKASDRVSAFAGLWRASVDLDLSSRRRTWGSLNVSDGILLSTILEDSMVDSVIKASQVSDVSSFKETTEAAKSSRGTPAAQPSRLERRASQLAAASRQATYSEAREEMVTTLLLTLLLHPQARVHVPEAVSGSRADSDKLADDARREQHLKALDWVRVALFGLQSMALCLTWDPAPITVPDTWLHLLQHSAAVCRHLLKQGPSCAKVSLFKSANGSAGDTRSQDDASEEFEAVQKLLANLMHDLQLMNPSLRPRALWVLAHHLNLHPSQETTWKPLLANMMSMASEVSNQKDRHNKLALAAAQGILPAVDGSAGLDGADPHGIHSTQLQAVVLSIERLTGLLSLAQFAAQRGEGVQNSDGALLTTLDDDEKEFNVANTAKLLGKVVAALLQAQHLLGPDMGDCCHRIQRQLRSLQDGDQVPPGQASSLAARGLASPAIGAVGGYGLFQEEDFAVAEGYPFGEAALQTPGSTSRATKLDRQARTAVAEASLEASNHTEAEQTNPGLPVIGLSSGEVELAAQGMWALGLPPQGAHSAVVPSPAELAASLAGLLPPAPGAAAAEAASCGRGGQSKGVERTASPWRQLTGPSDPVHLMAQHIMHPESNTVSFFLQILNPLQSLEMETVHVSLGLSGPLHAESRQPSLVWRPNSLVPNETQRWETRLWVSAFGQLTVHTRVMLAKGRKDGQVVDLSIRCSAYDIPMPHLMQSPSMHVSPTSFFQRWEALPARWEGCATAHSAGSGQAAALLSAIENCTPFLRVWLRGLPAIGGFQAAYQAATWSREVVALVVIAQLLPSSPGMAALDSSEATNAAMDTGREVVRLSVRSSCHEVITAIQESPASWVSDISGSLLALGLASSPAMPPLLPSRKPRLLPLSQEVMRPESVPSTRAPSTTDLLSDYGANTPGGAAEQDAQVSAEEQIVQQAAMAEWKRLHAAA